MARVLTLSAALVVSIASVVAAQAPGDPISARDFGASGSEHQSTAATTEGSRDITVTDVGDFQVGQGVMVSRRAVGA